MRRQEWKISCHINKTNTVKNKEVKTQTEEEKGTETKFVCRHNNE